MQLIPNVAAYAALVVFAAAVIGRFLMFKRLPMHLRWELYPVAHEGARADHGGSYMEEFEWWKRPRTTSLAGELKVMIPEIVFLVALREHNRRMWYASFPFHFGLYLVIGCTALMMAGGILFGLWPALAGGALETVLDAAVGVLGYAGLVLGMIGACGLLLRRLRAPELKSFTTSSDLFNLVFFLVAFGVSLLHLLLRDPGFAAVSAFVGGLVTFAPAAAPGGWLIASVVLLSVLLAYIPLTHMSHFVGKYFAYHAVRWGDEPNLPGVKSGKKIGTMLNKPVGWAAPHIQGEHKTWAEAATEPLAASKEKNDGQA